MSTLDALHRAVVADPADRTVRLAYADALDETGTAAGAARAEFIRGQVAAEAGDPAAPPPMRLEELFERHWVDWWRPVCAAAGLPVPRARGRRLRDRVARAVEGDWPYTAAADTVRLVEYGVAVRFAGGFPEEVRFRHFDTPENARPLAHRWGDAMPLVRLAFDAPVAPEEWRRVDGPHLARLPELSFDRIADDATAEVASSPHLAALARLSLNPVGANPDAVRLLVAAPPWGGLRSLHLTGRLGPDAVAVLAASCTLPHLEELDLTLGDPVGLGGAVGQVLTRMIEMFTRAITFPTPAPVRWADFGPALEALAAAPWVRRLRRLRVAAGENGLTRVLGGRGDDFLPDAAVRALADAAGAGRLDALVLPAGVVRPAVREEVAARPGGRVAFA